MKLTFFTYNHKLRHSSFTKELDGTPKLVFNDYDDCYLNKEDNKIYYKDGCDTNVDSSKLDTMSIIMTNMTLSIEGVFSDKSHKEIVELARKQFRSSFEGNNYYYKLVTKSRLNKEKYEQ